MNAVKRARRLIATRPETGEAKGLASLVLALESGSPFDLGVLYAMDLASFELALEILKEWRLDRYYAGKAKLFDLSWQMRDMEPPTPTSPG